VICVRCGYCCKELCVIIVDDPEKGLDVSSPDCRDNLVYHGGNGKRCKHLRGDKAGEYSCAIHDEPWYKDTPCYSHSQIERSPDDVCRMGEYILRQENASANT